MQLIQFDEKKHQYSIDGKVLPSVTEICKPLTVYEAEGAKQWLRDEAADRGRRIHEYCALIDYDCMPDYVDEDCIMYVSAYLEFLRDYSPDWTHIEHIVYNTAFEYAGMLDRMGYIDENLCILDIKTGSKINKVALTAQLTGYENLVKYADNPALYRLYGLHLKKDGTYKLIEVDQDCELFGSCMYIYNKMKGDKR